MDWLSVRGGRVLAVPRRILASRAKRLVALLAMLTVAFLALTIIARSLAPNEVDLAATRWLQQWANPALTWLMLAVSWPGFPPQSYAIPFVVSAAFALRGLRADALWLLGSQMLPIANRFVKEFVQRSRPSDELVRLFFPMYDYSFPSGHVVYYTSLFGFTFFLVYVLAPGSRGRSVLLVALGLMIVLVGLSRMYLGNHWLSDVLGGYTLAAAWLVIYCWAYARLRLHLVASAQKPA